ncbi:MAG: hypothetical protein ACYTFT_10815 [Planctomycetota bacterium]
MSETTPAPESADSESPESEAEGREPLAIPEPGLPTAKVDYLYRIFCPKPDMPSLDDILTRLIAKNPYNPEGGFVFPPPDGLRRVQDALGASKDYFVMGYLREEAPAMWEEAEAVIAETRLSPEDETTVRKSPLCIVIRAQIENPEDNRYIETLVHLAGTFRDLMHGVVWDVYMGKIWPTMEWPFAMEALLSPQVHVNVSVDEDPEEAFATLTTRGLIKFGSVDLEVCRVPLELTDDTRDFLLDASEHLILGDLLEPGEVITYRDTQILTVATPTIEGKNEILRLVDAPASEDDPIPDTDGSEGAPRLVEAIKLARIQIEGERARGGIAAS